MPGSPKWSLSSGFPTTTLYNPLLSPIILYYIILYYIILYYIILNRNEMLQSTQLFNICLQYYMFRLNESSSIITLQEYSVT